MINRIIKTPRNKRFLVWLFHICGFLGHDRDGICVDRSRLWSSGNWGWSWHYYCRRCRQWWDLDDFDNYQLWVRNLPKRLIHYYIQMPIIRFRNRRAARRQALRWERDCESYLAYLEKQRIKYSAPDQNNITVP